MKKVLGNHRDVRPASLETSPYSAVKARAVRGITTAPLCGDVAVRQSHFSDDGALLHYNHKVEKSYPNEVGGEVLLRRKQIRLTVEVSRTYT